MGFMLEMAAFYSRRVRIGVFPQPGIEQALPQDLVLAFRHAFGQGEHAVTRRDGAAIMWSRCDTSLEMRL